MSENIEIETLIMISRTSIETRKGYRIYQMNDFSRGTSQKEKKSFHHKTSMSENIEI